MNKFFSKVNATHKKNQHTSLNFESQYNNQKKINFFKCITITSIHQFINNGAFLGLYTELKSG